MWIADGWNDYELLDCGSGEKLERWGGQILVRVKGADIAAEETAHDLAAPSVAFRLVHPYVYGVVF